MLCLLIFLINQHLVVRKTNALNAPFALFTVNYFKKLLNQVYQFTEQPASKVNGAP